MQVKAVLIDFDGTITTKDILDVVLSLAGKAEESAKLKKLNVGS